MVDSLDISTTVEYFGGGGLYSYLPYGLETVARECVSNQHLLCFLDLMEPGEFLASLFPKGFPPHLKKLHLRNPLIVNCTEILRLLRNCPHLKDLSLFVVFNLNRTRKEHGLPPGLEALELYESGGTILPTFYGQLKQFRYTFIGKPSTGDKSTVRQFIEHTHIRQLELNVVTSRDFKEAMKPAGAVRHFGSYQLKKMKSDYYQFGHRGSCRLSKRASPSLREYIINLITSGRRP